MTRIAQNRESDQREIAGTLKKFFTSRLQERKLVEVARVMAKEPEILVVDETTTALSQRGRELLYRLISDLMKCLD